MSKTSKHMGIDERVIKCCSDSKNSIESGISFDSYEGKPSLRFHFLQYIGNDERKILTQKTKGMVLNKKNTKQLIKALKKLTFDD